MVDPALREGADVAGDRWVLLTLAALVHGPRRFGDLIAEVEGIAPNVLTDRLRRMERQGLVVAAPYSQRPRRYVYDLTESGRDLATLLPALSAWAGRQGGAEPQRHAACGSVIERRAWCPRCATVLDGDGTPGGEGDAGLRWL